MALWFPGINLEREAALVVWLAAWLATAQAAGHATGLAQRLQADYAPIPHHGLPMKMGLRGKRVIGAASRQTGSPALPPQL